MTKLIQMQVYFKTWTKNGFSKKKNHESAKTYSRQTNLIFVKTIYRIAFTA
jgi:hypothetical protein